MILRDIVYCRQGEQANGKRKQYPPPHPLCGCGCGSPVKKRRNGSFNAFIVGHNPKYSKQDSSTTNGHSSRFQAGNTYGKGRPVGSKNGVTLAVENLIQGEGEALSRKLIELALDGNVACLKTAIERLVPVCKSRPIILSNMPKIINISEASTLTGYVLDAVAEGRISPIDGEVLSRSCERHLKALEVRDLEQRLAIIESRMVDR